MSQIGMSRAMIVRDRLCLENPSMLPGDALGKNPSDALALGRCPALFPCPI